MGGEDHHGQGHEHQAHYENEHRKNLADECHGAKILELNVPGGEAAGPQSSACRPRRKGAVATTFDDLGGQYNYPEKEKSTKRL
jgi:hypothetical protein